MHLITLARSWISTALILPRVISSWRGPAGQVGWLKDAIVSDRPLQILFS